MHARPHHIPLHMLTRRRSGTSAPVARPGLRAPATCGARVRRISQRRERCALGNRVERVEETGESLGGAAGADETQPPGSLAALGHAGSPQSVAVTVVADRMRKDGAVSRLGHGGNLQKANRRRGGRVGPHMRTPLGHSQAARVAAVFPGPLYVHFPPSMARAASTSRRTFLARRQGRCHALRDRKAQTVTALGERGLPRLAGL